LFVFFIFFFVDNSVEEIRSRKFAGKRPLINVDPANNFSDLRPLVDPVQNSYSMCKNKKEKEDNFAWANRWWDGSHQSNGTLHLLTPDGVPVARLPKPSLL